MIIATTGEGRMRFPRGAHWQARAASSILMEAFLNELHALSARRTRVATTLTLLMVIVYFGFIALVAFGKGFLATLLAPGLSWGILLGALVIVGAWVLTFVYVRWANTVYDEAIHRLRG